MKKSKKRDVDFDFVLTDRPGHATDIARECVRRGVDIVIAVGGDGTISETVTGVIDSNTVLGIVPTGSTNVLAKDLGIPKRIAPAIDLALGNGVAQEFDVGRARDAIFMHIAGAGYDGHIMHEASSRLKRWVGWPAYMLPAVRHLRSQPFTVNLDVDGVDVTVNARMVLCAIGGSIVHPRFTVGRGIDRTDGLLDVCIYNPPNAVTATSALAWILLRKPNRSRWQRQFRGKRVSLRSDERVPFEADGNPLGILPVDVEILDQRARILVPRKSRS